LPQHPKVLLLTCGSSSQRLASQAMPVGSDGAATEGRHSASPPGHSAASMPEGSLSCHVLPSPPHPPSPPPPPHPRSLVALGAPSRRPWFEKRIIPRSTAIDAAEAQLDNALFAVVGVPTSRPHPTRSRQLFSGITRSWQGWCKSSVTMPKLSSLFFKSAMRLIGSYMPFLCSSRWSSPLRTSQCTSGPSIRCKWWSDHLA
jgi:hypothetical protein